MMQELMLCGYTEKFNDQEQRKITYEQGLTIASKWGSSYFEVCFEDLSGFNAVLDLQIDSLVNNSISKFNSDMRIGLPFGTFLWLAFLASSDSLTRTLFQEPTLVTFLLCSLIWAIGQVIILCIFDRSSDQRRTLWEKATLALEYFVRYIDLAKEIYQLISMQPNHNYLSLTTKLIFALLLAVFVNFIRLETPRFYEEFYIDKIKRRFGF
ncbi:hypothetical protein FGO68_gene10219 [Halteria grandinella]|uniref:Uncharacterized protein n=1 Tax=Halteria grandinella TaxID=5974 RepID=A0A8J8NLF5_HALGN|nr:hypothetical protein FGO68_gene10219 [Halteria grandinella]